MQFTFENAPGRVGRAFSRHHAASTAKPPAWTDRQQQQQQQHVDLCEPDTNTKNDQWTAQTKTTTGCGYQSFWGCTFRLPSSTSASSTCGLSLANGTGLSFACTFGPEEDEEEEEEEDTPVPDEDAAAAAASVMTSKAEFAAGLLAMRGTEMVGPADVLTTADWPVGVVDDAEEDEVGALTTLANTGALPGPLTGQATAVAMDGAGRAAAGTAAVCEAGTRSQPSGKLPFL